MITRERTTTVHGRGELASEPPSPQRSDTDKVVFFRIADVLAALAATEGRDRHERPAPGDHPLPQPWAR